jgi:hypothetical protein
MKHSLARHPPYVSRIVSDQQMVSNTTMSERLFDPEDPIAEEEDNIGDVVDSDEKTVKRKKGKGKGRVASKGDCKADAIDTNTSKADTQRPKPRPKAKTPKSAEHMGDSLSDTIGLPASSSSSGINSTSLVAMQSLRNDDFNAHHSPQATPSSSPALTPPPATQPRRQVTPPPSPPPPPRTPSPDFSFSLDSSVGKSSQEPGRKRKPISPISGDRAHRREPFSSFEGRSPVESMDDDVPANIGGLAGILSRSVDLGAGSVRGLPALGKNRGSRR